MSRWSGAEKRVDFDTQKQMIFDIVIKHGELSDLEAWRKAFPKVNFMEVDDGMTGKPIKWESYSPTEKAAYVAYMQNPQNSVLTYRIDIIDDTEIHYEDDSERLWMLWFYHAFQALDDVSNLTERTLIELAYHATAGAFQDTIMGMVEDEPDLVALREASFSHESVVNKKS